MHVNVLGFMFFLSGMVLLGERVHELIMLDLEYENPLWVFVWMLVDAGIAYIGILLMPPEWRRRAFFVMMLCVIAGFFTLAGAFALGVYVPQDFRRALIFASVGAFLLMRVILAQRA